MKKKIKEKNNKKIKKQNVKKEKKKESKVKEEKKKEIVKNEKSKKNLFEEEKEIHVKGLKSILRVVGNKDYIEISNEVKKINKIFFNRGFEGTFKNKNEIKKFFEERILEFLQGIYIDLKSEISSLRKEGKDVDCIDFEVLMIPLKIKVLGANFNFKEFTKLKKMIFDSNKELNKLKKKK